MQEGGAVVARVHTFLFVFQDSQLISLNQGFASSFPDKYTQNAYTKILCVMSSVNFLNGKLKSPSYEAILRTKSTTLTKRGKLVKCSAL